MEGETKMKHAQLQMIKAIALSQLILETLDSIAETNQFKQELKKNTNHYRKFLESYVAKHSDELFLADQEIMQNILVNSEIFVNTNLEEFILSNTFADPSEVQ